MVEKRKWYLDEYRAHYNLERNHQGLGNDLLTPLPANTNADGSIQCRERLGGILKYFRDAARSVGDPVGTRRKRFLGSTARTRSRAISPMTQMRTGRSAMS